MVKSNKAQSTTQIPGSSDVKSHHQENRKALVFKQEVDPDLLSHDYNQTRRPSLPYGIIINDNPAGILIPYDQLVKAEWKQIPPVEELTTVELTEAVSGLFLLEARMLILAFVPEYIRYKDIKENGEIAGTFVGLYDDYRQNFDKKIHDACSEHALIFLDPKNQPLHQVPIVVRFKNVALWSFKSAREEFYRHLERAFADYFNVDYSGKNDKWRSLGVLNIEFRAVKEGEGKNKSFCCKTHSITKPTESNLPKLYLGKPQQKKTIWSLHNSIAGFTEAGEAQLPALAAGTEPEVQVLPPENSRNKGKSKPPRKIAQVEAEPDAELKELDNFDVAAEVEVEVDAEAD